jgi:hypothetical protein
MEVLLALNGSALGVLPQAVLFHALREQDAPSLRVGYCPEHRQAFANPICQALT